MSEQILISLTQENGNLNFIFVLYAISLILTIVPSSAQARNDNVASSAIEMINKRGNAETVQRDYQVSFGYMNDNFITRRTFEPILNVGKDDNVTASFWLQIAWMKGPCWWSFNVYDNIITNKKEGYRTDLLSVYPSVQLKFDESQILLGLGLIARGNFGGGNIQSAYHNLADITPVNLPYVKDNSAGALLLTGYEYIIFAGKRFTLDGYIRNTIRGVSGPSTFRTGVKSDWFACQIYGNYSLQFQAISGYLTTYWKDEYIDPIFGSGGYQALLASVGYVDMLLVSTWISLNQFGLHQTHFGVTLTIGWNGLKLGDLEEVIYP